MTREKGETPGRVCSGEGTHQEVVMKETLARVCTPGAGDESSQL